MKKLIVLVLAFIVLSMAACGNSKQNETIEYSFHGENEHFSITEGSIVISSEGTVFNGGILEFTDPSFLNNIISYSASYYSLLSNNEREVFYSSTVNGLSENVSHSGEALGTAGSSGILVGHPETDLRFELKTVDTKGKESIYQVELTLTELKN